MNRDLAISVHTHYRIVSLNRCSPTDQDMLMAMGLVPGQRFYIAHIAPLGDPYIITLGHSQLVVRQQWLNAMTLTVDHHD